MPNSDITRVNRALETVEQVRAVNHLIQRICCCIGEGELSEREAEGLYVVLEWQNQQMQQAQVTIKTVLGAAALVKVAC